MGTQPEVGGAQYVGSVEHPWNRLQRSMLFMTSADIILHIGKVDTSWYVRLRSLIRTQILPGGTERKWVCPPPTSQLNLVSLVAISANDQEPLIYSLVIADT